MRNLIYHTAMLTTYLSLCNFAPLSAQRQGLRKINRPTIGNFPAKKTTCEHRHWQTNVGIALVTQHSRYHTSAFYISHNSSIVYKLNLKKSLHRCKIPALLHSFISSNKKSNLTLYILHYAILFPSEKIRHFDKDIIAKSFRKSVQKLLFPIRKFNQIGNNYLLIQEKSVHTITCPIGEIIHENRRQNSKTSGGRNYTTPQRDTERKRDTDRTIPSQLPSQLRT